MTVIETTFSFDNLDEANLLLSFAFGEDAACKNLQTEIDYHVAVFSKRSAGQVKNG